MQSCCVGSVGQLNTARDAAFKYAPVHCGAQSNTQCGIHCDLQSDKRHFSTCHNITWMPSLDVGIVI